ncbi:MAG: spore coat associated protein CotJA [Oscillospiraceae bacterium]|nr:spore coat associated protein CotJA [Oscillospiraceae bacterium]
MENQNSSSKGETQVLAMAYVTRQKWQNIYKHESGFPRGTIFADLDKPWIGSRRAGGGVK